jgi:hypothetical protein
MGERRSSKNPKKDPRARHPRVKTDFAFADALWNEMATVTPDDSQSEEMCEKKCRFFQPFSGPMKLSGKYGSNEGKCRAANNVTVTWGSTPCKAPSEKRLKTQGS